MRLLWISIICLLVGIASSRLCPDGKFCNGGACCPRYVLSGPVYECCSFGCGFLGGCSQAQNARLKRPKVDKGSLIDREFPLDRDDYVPPSDLMDMLSMESNSDSSGAQNARSKRPKPKVDIGSLIDREFPLDRDNYVPPSDLMDILSIESNFDSSGAQNVRSKRPKPKVDRDSLIDRDDSILPSDLMDMLSLESIDWDNFIPPPKSKAMPSIESNFDSSGAQNARSKRPKPKVDKGSLIDREFPLDRDNYVPSSDLMAILSMESIDWDNFVPPSELKDFQMSWFTKLRDKFVNKAKDFVKEKLIKIKDAIIDSI